MRRSAGARAAPLALLFVACAAAPASPPPSKPARGAPGLVLDLSAGTSAGAGFFDAPFPSDARRRQDGTVDFAGFPNPGDVGVVEAALAASHPLKGFSPNQVITFRFDGPFSPPPDDPLASIRPDAKVFVVDVDPASPQRGSRHPIHVGLTARADSVRPAHLLQLLPVPGLGLPPDRAYAAVVLRDAPQDGARLAVDETLRRLLSDDDAAVVLGHDDRAARRHRAALAPLRAMLPELGLAPDDVAAATVFTVADPTRRLRRMVAHVWAEEPPRLLDLRVRDEHEAFTALVGRFEVPVYQEGLPPYLIAGGALRATRGGRPIPQGRATAEMQLSIPKGRMPAKGFPLYFYVHGTGGKASQAIDRGRRASVDDVAAKGSGLARLVSPAGYATSCMAGPFSPDRIGALALDGYAAYNFFRPDVMRDNFAQMILEQVRFLRLLSTMRIDPALAPGTDASAAEDGKIRFDTDALVVGGQSLGSYLSGMLAGALPVWRGAILTGAGGSWIEFAFGPKDPVDLQALLEGLILPSGEALDRFHPFVALVSHAAAEADNTHYTRRILRAPDPGAAPPHVLIVEGHVDLQVPTNLQRALVLSVGADLLGEDTGAPGPGRLEPVLPWGGLRALRGAAQDNFALPGGARRTAVVVRYPEDGILEGHYVWMQREEPKRQIRAFVEAIAAGASPKVLDLSGGR